MWVGVGATIVAYALATVVKLPLALGWALILDGVAMVAAPYVPWRLLAHAVSKRLGKLAQSVSETGKRQASAEACAAAATALDALLSRRSGGLWLEPGLLSARRTERRLIDDYHREAQEVVMDAIHAAWQTISVPAPIRRCAEHPRGAADLMKLRDWLRRLSEEA